eukprot:6449958-Pyramimonas_sp.AAC.1
MSPLTCLWASPSRRLPGGADPLGRLAPCLGLRPTCTARSPSGHGAVALLEAPNAEVVDP